MALDFTPIFADLVRGSSTSVGLGPLAVRSTPAGYRAFADVLQVGERFYYCARNAEKPAEYEIGRGTWLADASIGREPDGAAVNFSAGTKIISLVAASEWFDAMAAAQDEARRFAASGPGAAQRTVVAKLGETVSAEDYGAVGDGVSDDTAAIAAAFAASACVRFGARTYLVSSIQLGAGKKLETAGLSTRFKQKAGVAAGTRIISVVGSNVVVGDLTVEGNIASDSGEQNHGVAVSAVTATGDISNVSIGNVRAINIRGDGVYLGNFNGQKLRGVRVGNIVAENIYRNGLSITGGHSIEVASVGGTACGMLVFDIEGNVGQGPSSGIRIGAVKGHRAAIVGPTAAEYIDGVEIGMLDLNPAHMTGSTPAYTGGTISDDGLQFRNLKFGRVGKFKASGFNRGAIFHIWNAGELAKQTLAIGHCEVSNCSLTDAVYNAFFVATKGVTRLLIDRLEGTVAVAAKRLLSIADMFRIGTAEIALTDATAVAFNDCDDGLIENLSVTGSGIVFSQCDRTIVQGGTVAATANRLFSYCRKMMLRNVNATVTSVVVGNSGDDEHYLGNCTINGTYWDGPYKAAETAANIASAASVVNGFGKFAGRLLWDSSNNRMMRASGSATTSAWHVIDGSATVTPA